MSDPLLALSQTMMREGSKSFNAAARLLPGSERSGAYLLYAWCRRCDDIIDGQELGHGVRQDPRTPRQRMAFLREQTARALQGVPGEDPAFHGLALVAQRFELPHELPFDLLAGFEMDVAGRRYEALEDTLAYAYHVAGVVGVMMAHIMGARDSDTLNRAADLGIAFQLTNIARDVVADAGLGRVYLPETWLRECGVDPAHIADPTTRTALSEVAGRLLDVGESFYCSARVGLDRLPPRCAWAIATALRVYRDIGVRVRKLGPHAWDGRVSTSRRRKLYRACGGLKDVLRRALPWPRGDVRLDRSGLWTRPMAGNA
jgi:phytoene synthase